MRYRPDIRERFCERAQMQPGYMTIDSSASGMSYITHEGDNRILIITDHGGRTILDMAQLAALATEGIAIIKLYGGGA